ncbi:ATP-binding cassette domain-containing protein [Gudongella sp. DL1XJH-153]|uniref:ATP-binding cassette domain-containing protein n=1 Tax=Gudongella sp. DL1XJH-153 TaxID=3409804 RepID=UPI003BB5BEEA
MSNIIEVNNLKKSYGKIEAVKGIDFYLEKGKLFAFLGPNGAGKSTTIDILSTLIKPDEGKVIINGYTLGKDDNNIRSSIGVVFQDNLLDNLLTVKENLEIRGSFYNLENENLKLAIKRAVDVCEVNEFINRPYGKLSGGQRRRSDIARSLINTPEILFLDEPTTGLDPQTRKNIWDTIRKMQRDNNMTVFLTTHYMEEAAEADYVIVIDHGEIIAKGTPSQLKDKYSTDRLILTARDIEEVRKRLLVCHIDFQQNSDNIQVNLESTFEALNIIREVEDVIESFEVLKGTMDDAFIQITGKEMRG